MLSELGRLFYNYYTLRSLPQGSSRNKLLSSMPQEGHSASILAKMNCNLLHKVRLTELDSGHGLPDRLDIIREHFSTILMTG